jgi:hypothetical protein
MKMRNPVQGVRGRKPRSTCPAWGVSSLVTGRTGVDLLRGLLANPVAANSSTTKGPRGLAGESCERRSRIVKDLGRWVRGCFYVRSPEMRAVLLSTHPRNYAGSGELDIRPTFLPVTRDSHVSREMKGMTNAGSSAAAGLVPGASTGRRGESKRSVQRRKSDQRKRTIRNRAVARIRWRSDRPNAVEWECGLSRKLSCHLAGARWTAQAMFPARQWGLVDVVTGGADGNVTTKGLTGSM